MRWCENYDLTNVITPLDVDTYESFLNETGFDKEKSRYLVDGFRNGFSLEFEGNRNVKRLANNLCFRIGTPHEMWDKIMNEVESGRHAGPYEEPPFENYAISNWAHAQRWWKKDQIDISPVIST